MYKLFTQAQYDDNGTRTNLVNVVYTTNPQHPHTPDTEWYKIQKSYGSIENYLKTPELEF